MHTTEHTKETHTFKRLDLIILSIIIVLGFIFRLYKTFDTPLADLHSWRQVDTAAVARNFVKDGFDLLKPRYDDLSSLQSGMENPEGVRFVEFPIYNAIVAGMHLLYRGWPIEVWGRLVSSFFSLFIIGVIYYLALKERDRTTAIIAAAVFAFFPWFVYFSRMVLPETMATAYAMLSIFFFYLYAHKEKNRYTYVYFALSLITYAVSILVKPTAGFYGLAIACMFFRMFRFKLVMKWQPYVFLGLALAPFIVWRMYISQFPVGIPASSWLITHVNTWEGQKNIFFKPAFFRWIFFERIGIMMFGAYLSFFFILGALTKPKKYLLHVILACAFIYLFTFQGGNVQHEYYQTILLPAFALFIGAGASWIIQNGQLFIHPLITYATIIVTFAFAFSFSYYRVKDFYGYPQDLVQIANVIKTLTKPTDKIVTDRLGDTTLLYLADRRGSPAIHKNLTELKNDGYKYLVTQSKDKMKELKEQGYVFLFENDQFAVVKF